MRELELRLCNNIFYKQDNNKKKSVYHDPVNNNMILFWPCDVDTTIESVCNATVSEGAYEYLTNVLNTEKSVLIIWSEVSGTTSDYTIYYDYNVSELMGKKWKEIIDSLPGRKIFMKFVQVKYGVESALLKEDRIF